MNETGLVTKQSIIDKARAEGRTELNEVESKEFLKKARISVIDTRLATSREKAISVSRKLGFPVALKITSPDIVHKSDAGGVKLGLKRASQVGKAHCMSDSMDVYIASQLRSLYERLPFDKKSH